MLLVGGQKAGWVAVIAAGWWTVGYGVYGTVYAAWRHAQGGELAKAKEILAQTRFPQLLTPQAKSYRSWLQGSFAAERRDWEAAHQGFLAAAEGSLRTLNDRSMIHALLASTEAARGNLQSARAHLEEARSTPHNPENNRFLELAREEINELESQL